jgi:hypothetical protein
MWRFPIAIFGQRLDGKFLTDRISVEFPLCDLIPELILCLALQIMREES